MCVDCLLGFRRTHFRPSPPPSSAGILDPDPGTSAAPSPRAVDLPLPGLWARPHEDREGKGDGPREQQRDDERECCVSASDMETEGLLRQGAGSGHSLGSPPPRPPALVALVTGSGCWGSFQRVVGAGGHCASPQAASPAAAVQRH